MQKEKKDKDDYGSSYCKSWEKHYSLSKPTEEMKKGGWSNFSPMPASERAATYRKVNKEDY